MALSKQVRSVVRKAVARGAIYEDGVLKQSNGTVIVRVPQDHNVAPDKFKRFDVAVRSSGILDRPTLLPATNGSLAFTEELRSDESEEDEVTVQPESVGPDPDEELNTRQMAELLGVTPGAVHMAISNGRLPVSSKRSVPGEKGGPQVFVRRRDVEDYAHTRRPGPRRAITNGQKPAPSAAALVASVRPSVKSRFDLNTPSGRVSAGVARVRAAHIKLDSAMAELLEGLAAIETESRGMLEELAESRAKIKKVETLIGRAVDAL